MPSISIIKHPRNDSAGGGPRGGRTCNLIRSSPKAGTATTTPRRTRLNAPIQTAAYRKSLGVLRTRHLYLTTSLRKVPTCRLMTMRSGEIGISGASAMKEGRAVAVGLDRGAKRRLVHEITTMTLARDAVTVRPTTASTAPNQSMRKVSARELNWNASANATKSTMVRDALSSSGDGGLASFARWCPGGTEA